MRSLGTLAIDAARMQVGGQSTQQLHTLQAYAPGSCGGVCVSVVLLSPGLHSCYRLNAAVPEASTITGSS
jgi:hypothetical protein